MRQIIRPETKVDITLIRDHKTKTMTATVGDPKKLKQSKVSYFGGMRLQDFNELESDGSELHGVIVTGLRDSSAGALAGLQAGDVITAIDFKPIASFKALEQAIASQTKPITLTVARANLSLFLVLNTE